MTWIPELFVFTLIVCVLSVVHGVVMVVCDFLDRREG